MFKLKKKVAEIIDPEITDITINETKTTFTTAEAIAEAEVGKISVTGGTEPYSYSLEGTDSGSFKIEGTTIKIADSLTEKNYNATVKVTDSKSKTKTKDFSVTVTQAS